MFVMVDSWKGPFYEKLKPSDTTMNFSSQGKQRDEQSVTRVYGSQQTSQTSIWQRTQKSHSISKLPLWLKYAAAFFLSSFTGKHYHTCFLVSQ